ncbi:MAG: hypothetical protein GY861_16335 [bacterium]|nr:hypothetical protein [bacterium]
MAGKIHGTDPREDTCGHCKKYRIGADHGLFIGRPIRLKSTGSSIRISYEYLGCIDLFLCKKCIARRLLPYRIIGFIILILSIGILPIIKIYGIYLGKLWWLVALVVIALLILAKFCLIPSTITVNDAVAPLLRRHLRKELKERYGEEDTIVTWTARQYEKLSFG